MADEETEELVEGPRSSEVTEWGAGIGHSRQRDNYQVNAFFEPDHTEGFVWQVRRRPRRGRLDEPAPHTVRIMQPNPNGIVWSLVQKRKLVIRTALQDKAIQLQEILRLEQEEVRRGER